MTFNQQYFDATLRHQIDLLRFGAGVARKVNAVLDETRADLRKQVERRLGKNTALDAAGLRRLRELERAIDQQRSGAWNDVNEQWQRTALDVALEEPLFVDGALTSILPVELDLVQPSAGTLRAIATTRPFQGRTLKEWADSARRADLNRIHQQIRIGMVQGESAQDIGRRVFGARGAMEITRHQADAVTRTVINGVSNAAQQEFLKENSDLFDVEQLVATLDGRTSPICRAQDGKQYPVGQGPIPPLHVNCRSIRVAVIDGEVVGERPFRAGTEKQMLREYAEREGLKKAPASRDDLPKGHKKAFDAFSRKRMRELTGQVPARTTYQEWLKSQSSEVQDDILGPARGKLFREGGLTLDKFVARDGGELTLDELKERNRAAWERAGLAGGSPKEIALDSDGLRSALASRGLTLSEGDSGALESIRRVWGRDITERELDSMIGFGTLRYRFGEALKGTLHFGDDKISLWADTHSTLPEESGVAIARTWEASSRGERTARHEHFFLGSEVQGDGLGKQVLQNALTAYRELGLVRVDTSAAEIGKYYWPSIGFEPPAQFADEAMARYRAQMKLWLASPPGGKVGGLGLDADAVQRIVDVSSSLYDMVMAHVDGENVGKRWATSVLGPGGDMELDLRDGSRGWKIAKRRLGL